MTLYRGESRARWKRRTLGLSWTADPVVAKKFATDGRQCIEGGSVILSTVAPPEAIISYLDVESDRYGEVDYFVERRLLGAVRVHESFPQITHDEHFARERTRHLASSRDMHYIMNSSHDLTRTA